MGAIEATRAALEVEVRDNVHETPNPSKAEGWIAATMQAADAYAMAVLAELRGCAGHFERYAPGECECRSCLFRARIKALAAPQGPPERAGEEGEA